MILLVTCDLDRPDTAARIVPTCVVVDLDAESASFLLTRALRFEAVRRFDDDAKPDPFLLTVTYAITVEGEWQPGAPKVSAYYADEAELRHMVSAPEDAHRFIFEIADKRYQTIDAEPPGWVSIPIRDVELVTSRDGVQLGVWPAGSMVRVLSRVIPLKVLRRAAGVPEPAKEAT